MIKTIIILLIATATAYILFANPVLFEKMAELVYKLFIAILKAVAGFAIETVKAVL